MAVQAPVKTAAAGGGGHKASLYRSLDGRQKTADEVDVGQHRSDRRPVPLQIHHAIPLGTSKNRFVMSADVGEPQDSAISRPIDPLSLLIQPRFHLERFAGLPPRTPLRLGVPRAFRPPRGFWGGVSGQRPEKPGTGFRAQGFAPVT